MGKYRCHSLAILLLPVMIAAAPPPDTVPVPTARPGSSPAAAAPSETGTPDSIPLPTPRPDPLQVDVEPEKPLPLSAEEVSCLADLVELEVAFKAVDPVEGEGQCGIAHPIRVSGLSSGIALVPPGVMTCAVALSLENWTRETVAPTAKKVFFQDLDKIRNYSTYVCRTRNSQPGAKISEHARGNAVDVGQFVLESGRVIDVRSPPILEFLERGFLYAIRQDACDHFTTVLGPSTDSFHDNHFHFDMIQRRNGYHYCK